jgi:hypothetical protein
VDLRPPTVVRLERALAHWSSSRFRDCYGSGQIMSGATRPGSGRYTGPATAAAVTWLSLLTVKAIRV